VSDKQGGLRYHLAKPDPFRSVWVFAVEGLPEGAEFNRYLHQWLISPTDESCPLGGKVGYASAISFADDASNASVALSHFRTFHTPLKSQADFINALAAAERVADELSKATGKEVFPYSLPYVFFAQCGLNVVPSSCASGCGS